MLNTEKSSSTIEYIQEADFDRLSSSDGVFVFDFTATWCGPCKMIAPIMDKLAQAYQGSVQVFKVDLEENHSLAKRLSIRSIPSVMIYKDGNCTETIVGVVPYEKFDTIVSELI